jgi:hypothetical protein
MVPKVVSTVQSEVDSAVIMHKVVERMQLRV